MGRLSLVTRMTPTDPEGWGTGQTFAFRWTQARGMETFGSLGGVATGANADGSVVVGQTGVVGTAFRWTQATGIVSLGTLNGGYTAATAVSADSSVIVGWGLDGNAGHPRAFRWTYESGRIFNLGTLGGGRYSHPQPLA